MKSEELKAPEGAAFRIPKDFIVQEATADISLTEKEMDSIDHFRKLGGIDWFCKFTAKDPATGKIIRSGFLVTNIRGEEVHSMLYSDIIWDLSLQIAGEDRGDSFCVGPGTKFDLSMADMMRLRWIYQQSWDRAGATSKRRVLQCCSAATNILAVPVYNDKIQKDCKSKITREKIERKEE